MSKLVYKILHPERGQFLSGYGRKESWSFTRGKVFKSLVGVRNFLKRVAEIEALNAANNDSGWPLEGQYTEWREKRDRLYKAYLEAGIYYPWDWEVVEFHVTLTEKGRQLAKDILTGGK